MIISLIQTKGGTGKTTLAKCLAYSKTFRKAFGSICLIELDPQGTIAAWHSQRIEYNISDGQVHFVDLALSTHKQIESQLIKLVEENDTMILDVPGESIGKFATKLATSLSDIVLIPMRSSTNDEQSFINNIYPVIEEISANANKERKGFFIVPTFVHPQTKSKNVQDYFMEIMPENIGCLDTFLPSRSVYENYSREGLNLHEYAKSVKGNSRHYGQAKKAINDIEKIAKNILNLTD